MSATEGPNAGPPLDDFDSVFRVYEARRDGDRLVYYGEPLVPSDELMQQVWPLFREQGYEVQLSRQTGEHVLVAEPIDVGIDGIPWTNVILFVVTVLSTLYAGTMWYYVRDPLADPMTLLRAWPFAAAVIGVLGIHELGHYVMSRYHDVEATLPYFIPMPTIIGTMGAVIRMKGQIPDRRALFDIGVAGPIAGLIATVVVTAIGLLLPPIEVPTWVVNSPNTFEIQFGYPLLFQLIADVLNQPIDYQNKYLAPNPVVFGGWVGMFVTFLNLLPVGQLDGGHIVRALVGKRQLTVAALVPAALFGLAGALQFTNFFGSAGNASGIWIFWGLFSLVLAYAGPADPIDEGTLDTKRRVIGLLTLFFGLLCFTPVPIQIVG
ncbi:MAG: site-2 protease family protein [Halobacteriales archaeon]|nr:site-2 protease family protein [Halobacteriales archaeon]